MAHTTLTPAEVVRHGLEIAGDMCIYTNRNIDVIGTELDASAR